MPASAANDVLGKSAINHPTCLEERHLIAAYLGLRPPQPVSVEGDRAPKVVHTKCNEAQPWFHCSAPFSSIGRSCDSYDSIVQEEALGFIERIASIH
jgi:hypothetical protein